MNIVIHIFTDHFSIFYFNHYNILYVFLLIQFRFIQWERENIDFLIDVSVFRNLQDNYIVVAGDGQMDSPGHSAKHCVYSLMDATNYYILHVENIDVRITKHKSSVMEKKGCELGLSVLLEQLEIDEFVSDANTQIIKMLRKFFHIISLLIFIVILEGAASFVW